MKLKLAVAGVTGRMGHALIEKILDTSDVVLTGAIDIDQSQLNQDPAAFLGKYTGIKIVNDLRIGLKNSDYLIDFTRPEGTMHHLRIAKEMGIKAVIGTTGFTNIQKQELKEISHNIPIVLSPNMSIGMNAVLKIIELASKMLHKEYDIEIIDYHHKHKVDSPSGTSIWIGEIISQTLGVDVQDIAVYSHINDKSKARKSGAIGFSSVRGGDIVGDHVVLFCGTGERIEIHHKSTSRIPYAQGAIHAARFLEKKRHGIFNMYDVLNDLNSHSRITDIKEKRT